MVTAARAMLVLLVLAAIASPIQAHEKFKIVGTVAKVHPNQLDVKALDGHLYEIDITDTTKVTRDLKKVNRSELRAGAIVTVHALGHDMFDLEAVEVQLMRALPPQ